MKKFLNLALLVTFVLTVLVPLTGVHVHKLMSVLFLLLCAVHTVLYRKKLGLKRYLLLALVAVSFLSGIFGMTVPAIMTFHRVISIILVFFMAIHIFVFHRRMMQK